MAAVKSRYGAKRGGVYLLRVGPRRYYFGVAANFAKRRGEHLNALRRGDHHNSVLQCAYNKHGEGSFRFEPIIWCGRETAAKTEAWLIQTYALDGNCANLRLEDGTTYSHSEETRRRISESQKGKVIGEESRRKMSEAGRRRAPISDETRRKLSDAQRGKKYSEESRRKISKALRGKPRSEEHCRKLSEAGRGRTRSKETRRKISEAVRNRAPDSEETRRKKSEAAKRREAARRAAKENQVAERE